MNRWIILWVIGAVIIFAATALFIYNPAPPAVAYSSNGDRIEFQYPEIYNLQQRSDGFEGKTIKVTTLINKNVVVPDMGEGPPLISLIIVPNPEHLSLEEWVRTKSISNFLLSHDSKLTPTAVGQEPALGYTFSGLYENTAVAVAHAGNIYLFSVGVWSDRDQIKKDFHTLVASVKFL